MHLVLEICQGQSLSNLIFDDAEVDFDSDSCSSDDDQSSDCSSNHGAGNNSQKASKYSTSSAGRCSRIHPQYKTERDFKKIVRQLLYAIQVMHELGIAHRDLKPENIMLHEVPAFSNTSVNSSMHTNIKVD